MLTHQRARVALVAALLALGLWCWQTGASGWWLALPLVAYAAVVALGAARISSSFFVPTRCRAATSEPVIALTFDDGPVAATPAVLAVLARQQVPATFFCIGQRVQASPAVVRQLHAAGHLIGNHSFTHSYFFDFFPARRLARELVATDAAIAAAIGRRPRLFRPPYGVTTPALARAIGQAGHHCIGWSVRSLDTVARDERALLGRMVQALAPGAVFLFHDSSAATLAILEEFIQQTRQRGYRIVPLDALLNVAAYEADDLKRHKN